MVAFTLKDDVGVICAILSTGPVAWLMHVFSDLNNQQILQHRRWIPAVLVTIFHAVKSLHLLLVEFP